MTSAGAEPRLREHEFDGIREFDNHLPNWWLWSFYLACIFSVLYWIHFHTLGTGDLPEEEYRLEMEAAADRIAAIIAANPITEESLLQLAEEPAMVERGRGIFAANCVLCHTEDASGNVGPNLTDEYWLHGGKAMDIYTTVTKGWPELGMQSWEEPLGPLACQAVVAYVLSIKGQNLPGKPPDLTRAKKEGDRSP